METITTLSRQAIRRLKRSAWEHPWDGRAPLSSSHRLLLRRGEGEALSVLLSYDVGYHACGWWKNSQYDRAWHLSVCALKMGERDPHQAMLTPERGEVRAVARAFFGDDVRHAWNEPPAGYFDAYRTAPASPHTWHVRLFTDRAGQVIQPQGEVYDLVPFDDGTSPEKVFR